MKFGVQNFHGRRLTEARLARGLFKKALAEKIGVSAVAIGRYEDCLDNPQHDKLRQIAEQLDFPVEFFLRPAWSEELELVFWRHRSSETKYAREMTEQRMRWLCELFFFLEEEVDFPALKLPKIDLPSDFRLINSEMIEDIALRVRHHWGLRELPIPDVTLALENAGIPVVNLQINSEKQDGFCFRSKALERPFVGINVYNISSARARFDAAHELGHIILHRQVTPRESQDPLLHKLLEQQVHRFAGAFLFPRSSFMREVGAPTLYYFCDLKRRWGMSIAAMIYRAFDLGVIDEQEKSALYHNMARRHWRGVLREPFDSVEDMPLERPRMLRRALELVVESGTFGRSAIRSSLSLPQGEIEQLAGVEVGFLSEADVVSLVAPKQRNAFRTLDLETGEVIEFRGASKRPSSG
ncbi:ImmA/IrrE family metallo-endopeptidase [Bradyrhizobium sp. 83002]|uniref:helix-turn-helix domain-containing protein n=1 Tax=Bradyrhizobium aeschynomenes TaxID=2734909 RepID=UPI0015554467|nr:XRE family transcriptional regulator [Bradyrhizobium aeschynomenes]NPU14977.1 ImmA/IrrE family metallo-endopeptidase [Bradyrhizobium aeschynomenes]